MMTSHVLMVCGGYVGVDTDMFIQERHLPGLTNTPTLIQQLNMVNVWHKGQS